MVKFEPITQLACHKLPSGQQLARLPAAGFHAVQTSLF